MKTQKISLYFDIALLIGSAITFFYWFTGEGLFYSGHKPVMSPFTSFSILLMAVTRVADKTLSTWSKPMTLALLSVVACGNFSSLTVQLLAPELFLTSMPNIVSTSVLTSIGLILFSFYDVLVAIRKTPDNAFMVDDILIHLALFPGGLSLLGHIIDVPTYISAGIDPRVGISPLEMLFMGGYAVTAVIGNKDLFLWKFLEKSSINRIVFSILFLNQYIAPAIVAMALRPPQTMNHKPGIEFFVMLAGVLSTLVFLMIKRSQDKI